MNIINLRWDGPFTPKQAGGSRTKDLGLYQVYSYHPVYGDCLVYIGRTHKSFSSRIGAEGWDTPDDADPSTTKIFLATLREGQYVPEGKTAEDVINIAEALLIHSHAPAYNSTYIFHPPSPELVSNWIVRNFGASRSLNREVSGMMWSRAAEAAKKLGPLETQAIATVDPSLVETDTNPFKH